MPVSSPNTTDTLAQTLFDSLSGDFDAAITLPNMDGEAYQIPSRTGNPLYEPVAVPDNAALTTEAVGGTGTFDILMTAMRAHLKQEFQENRITGREYSEAYAQISVACLSSAVQFLLNREQIRWSALVSQAQAREAEINAVTAAVNLETAKVSMQAAQGQLELLETQYAGEKLKLSVLDADYDLKASQKAAADYQVSDMLPAQKTLVEQQTSLAQQQSGLVLEQTEAQRAQTMDTRLDGVTPVAGSVGKQKDLYSQQITSYQRDAEHKSAKMFLDAWITQHTMNNNLAPPDELTNATVETVMNRVRTNNGLV